jgi:hypothetical protein
LKYDQFDRAYCSLFKKNFGACEKCPKNTTLIRFSLKESRANEKGREVKRGWE